MKLVGKSFKATSNGVSGYYVVAGYIDEDESVGEPEFELDCKWMTPSQARVMSKKLSDLADKADEMSKSPKTIKLSDCRICKKHPTYQAKRMPTADCSACDMAWDVSWYNPARRGGQ